MLVDGFLIRSVDLHIRPRHVLIDVYHRINVIHSFWLIQLFPRRGNHLSFAVTLHSKFLRIIVSSRYPQQSIVVPMSLFDPTSFYVHVHFVEWYLLVIIRHFEYFVNAYRHLFYLWGKKRKIDHVRKRSRLCTFFEGH